MKKVGVTGGIGSGKTIVCQLFSVLGAPVYNADQRAKHIMHENPTVQNAITEAFGPESYIMGSLNRDHIAEKVFNDQNKLTLLNSIVHPEVASDYALWLKENQSHSCTIKEAALLIESGAYLELDYIIHVTAPLELKVKRVKARDDFRTAEEIKSIIGKQLSDEDRNARADFEIVNDENRLLMPEVLKIYTEILK